MTRDLDALTARPFDLLVVGGGIHGLMAAYDGATRGLRVALIERHDFGGAASFHHHRTLHGGLRYLQTGNLPRLRQSVRERRTWASIAPQFIEPQAFAMAAGYGAKPESLLRAGFATDALLAFDRNWGLPPALRLPPARLVGAYARDDLDTGDLLRPGSIGLWYDYRTAHAERLTLAVAIAASHAGAVLGNYLDAIEPIREGRRIAGFIARDAVDGIRVAVRAKVTINAAGAGAGRVMAAFGLRKAPLLVKAMNVVTRRPAPAIACGAPTRRRRLLFALPWQGRLAIGTWHGSTPCGADAVRVAPEDFESYLAEINEAFPTLHLAMEDITLVQRGVVPARRTVRGVTLAEHAIVREHRQDGVDGALSVIGVKYTTARAVAERAVTLAMAQLRVHSVSRTATRHLPGQVPDALHSPVDAIDTEAWRHLQRLYGTAAMRVADYARDDPSLAKRIVEHHPVIGAQVVHAVREEMALTLDDVILRRTGIGSAGYPGDEAVWAVERIMRQELGWSSTRAVDEVQSLQEFYLPVKVQTAVV